MKLTVLVPALAGLLWAGSALADAQLEVTNPYVVQLIDGQSINPKLLDKTNTFPLKAGKHQLVVAFEGNFSSRSDIKLVTAEPLVINFTAADNQKLVLDYKKPRNEAEAKQFVKEQKIALKDKSSNQVVASEQFVLPKVEGFQLTRDYQQELLNMGKAFNQPATVAVSTAAVMAANSAPVQVAPSKAQSNPEALTQLQNWYNKADAETRKAFQIWVIQQQ
ncbi:YccT family protein [Aeromonas hydrophila]